MKCFYVLLAGLFLSSPAFTLEEPLKSKIELIDNELCYCRYLIYEVKHEGIDSYHALEIIDSVLEIVFCQLEEISCLE